METRISITKCPERTVGLVSIVLLWPRQRKRKEKGIETVLTPVSAKSKPPEQGIKTRLNTCIPSGAIAGQKLLLGWEESTACGDALRICINPPWQVPS